jgi:hypothetical protein
MKGEVNKIKLDAADEFSARHILDAAGCITKSADKLRRTASDLCSPDAKCIGVDSGILKHLL